MTEKEKNRKMALDYLNTALMLKRSIAGLRKRRRLAKRSCDRLELDRKAENLERYYYEQVGAMDADCIRAYLTEEERSQIQQANRDISDLYTRRAERKRELDRQLRKKWKKAGGKKS